VSRDPDDARRAAWLETAGASGDVLEELLRYDTPLLARGGPAPPTVFPDEPHVGMWEIYAEDAARVGAIPALAARLPQLRFPVTAGVSATETYRAATRRGEIPDGLVDGGPAFARPGDISVGIHRTLGGRLPVLVALAREDFETLVRVFTARNEPVPVPRSMGACFVKGFNNWDRVHAYRRLWEEEHPGGDWSEGFAELVPQKELYEDRFMILSSGPYSSLPAEAAGFSEEDWEALSLRIRRDHECTHYFTLRAAGATRTNLLDEVVADYAGLVATFGRFREDLALLFFGLERFPEYRAGARLENYRGTPPVSDAALDVLKALVVRAIRAIARMDAALPASAREGAGLARVVLGLASLTLAEMASTDLAPFAATPGEPGREHVVARVKTTRAGLDGAQSVFGALAERHSLPARFRAEMLVVLDEVLSNVRRHAFGDRRAHDVELDFHLEPDLLTLAVADSGRPFDPLSLRPPDTTAPLAERPVGGLGVLIIRSLTESQSYERRDGRNHLRLTKRI